MTSDDNALICYMINTSLTLFLTVLVESLGSNILSHALIDIQKKGNVKDVTKCRNLNGHLKAEIEVVDFNDLIPMKTILFN